MIVVCPRCGHVFDVEEEVQTISTYDEKEDLKQRLNKKQRRLQELEQKAALYGFNVAPEVAIEIKDLEKEIAQLKAQLANL